MKILKKPKILPITCKRCGCVYQPKLKNLQICETTKVKDEVNCPICKTTNKANFDVARNEDFREIDDEQR